MLSFVTAASLGAAYVEFDVQALSEERGRATGHPLPPPSSRATACPSSTTTGWCARRATPCPSTASPPASLWRVVHPRIDGEAIAHSPTRPGTERPGARPLDPRIGRTPPRPALPRAPPPSLAVPQPRRLDRPVARASDTPTHRASASHARRAGVMARVAFGALAHDGTPLHPRPPTTTHGGGKPAPLDASSYPHVKDTFATLEETLRRADGPRAAAPLAHPPCPGGCPCTSASTSRSSTPCARRRCPSTSGRTASTPTPTAS